MITDQKQTGVPNGTPFSSSLSPQFTRQRVQTVKPQQVVNSGRTAPAAPATASIPQRPAYNPVYPGVAVPPTQQVAAATAVPTTPIQPTIPTATASAQAPLPQPVAASIPTPTAQAAPSSLDEVRRLIAGMDDEDIVQMLTDLSTGALKGRGPRQAAAPTAAPTVEPRI